MLQEKNESPKVGTGGKLPSEYVSSVTISTKQSQMVYIVVPNPSMDALKSGDESDGADIRERMFVRKYHSFSPGGIRKVIAISFPNLDDRTNNLKLCTLQS